MASQRDLVRDYDPTNNYNNLLDRVIRHRDAIISQVNTIRCSGETLLILITDILDFSRIEANKMVLSLHTFRLRSVVEAAMEISGLSAAQKRLQVGLLTTVTAGGAMRSWLFVCETHDVGRMTGPLRVAAFSGTVCMHCMNATLP